MLSHKFLEKKNQIKPRHEIKHSYIKKKKKIINKMSSKLLFFIIVKIDCDINIILFTIVVFKGWIGPG